MSTCTKSRRRVKKARTFRCTFSCDGDTYAVMPLRGVHPEVAVKAYRLNKNGGEEVYDVHLTPEGVAQCDCKGCQRWGHCKHLEMLVAMGCLPESSVPTAKATAKVKAAAKASDAGNAPAVETEAPKAVAVDTAPTPTAGELDEMLAGFPPAEPMTPEGIAEMADWFLADDAQRSARCPVCHGRKQDDMGGWCVGCGGLGIVPAS
jgi:hypothetical protein